MKKIIAVVLLLVMAVACVACSKSTSETKLYNYTIVNETGKAISKVHIADDNSVNKAEAKYDGAGMQNGSKAGISISAVPDKNGNPSLTVSYTIGNDEFMVKVNSAEAEIKLTAEGQDSGAFDVAAPQK